VTFSPLQKRIIELSHQVIEADDPAEFKRLAHELRLALRQQVSALREMVSETKKSISESRSEWYAQKNGTDD
jgi:hypothetical protein